MQQENETRKDVLDDLRQAFSWASFIWWGVRSALFLVAGAIILYAVGKDLITEANQGMRQSIQVMSDSLTRDFSSLTTAQQENTRQLTGLTAQVAAVSGKLDMLIAISGGAQQPQAPAQPRSPLQQQNYTVPTLPFDQIVKRGPIEIDLPKDGERFNAKVWTTFLAQTGALKDLPKGVTVFVPIDSSEIKKYLQTVDKGGRAFAWKYIAKSRVDPKALDEALKQGGIVSFPTFGGTQIKLSRSGSTVSVWDDPSLSAKIVQTVAYGESLVHFIDQPVVK